jgi:hypothetical protein
MVNPIPSQIITPELRSLWNQVFGFEIEDVVQESGDEIPVLNISGLIERVCDPIAAQYMPKPWDVLIREKKGEMASQIAQRVMTALWPKVPNFKQCDKNLGDLLAAVQEFEC